MVEELVMVLLAQEELVQTEEEPELEVEQALKEGPVQMVVGRAQGVEEQVLVEALAPGLRPPRAHYHRRQDFLVA